MVLISTNNQYLCIVLSLELSLMHVFFDSSENSPYIINKVDYALFNNMFSTEPVIKALASSNSDWSS